MFLFDKQLASNLANDLGLFGIISFLVAGSAIYFVYRYLLYENIVIWLHDVLRGVTYRTYLNDFMKICDGKRWLPKHSAKAERIFKAFRIFEGDNRIQEIVVRYSGIHFLYQAGILSLPFCFLSASEGDIGRLASFSTIAMTFLFSATLQDMREEDEELAILKTRMAKAREVASTFGLEYVGSE